MDFSEEEKKITQTIQKHKKSISFRSSPHSSNILWLTHFTLNWDLAARSRKNSIIKVSNNNNNNNPKTSNSSVQRRATALQQYNFGVYRRKIQLSFQKHFMNSCKSIRQQRQIEQLWNIPLEKPHNPKRLLNLRCFWQIFSVIKRYLLCIFYPNFAHIQPGIQTHTQLHREYYSVLYAIFQLKISFPLTETNMSEKQKTQIKLTLTKWHDI